MRINFAPNYNFQSNHRLAKVRKLNLPDVVRNPNMSQNIFDSIIYANTTNFFRGDLNAVKVDGKQNNWDGFVELILERFKDVPKVNVYDFACSDGSEAYSLILDLMDKGGVEAEKFFPIQAYDFDEEIIKTANSGEILCDDSDFRRFDENLGTRMRSYYSIGYSGRNDYLGIFYPSEKLKSKVSFKYGDFTKMIDEIEPSNSLVLCRNFWPYLNQKDVPELMKKLADRLDESSLVVVGWYDKNSSRWDYPEYFGFEQIAPYVFRKCSK